MKSQAIAKDMTADSVMENELATFVDLVTGEIKLAMKDASDSVNTLTRTFMEMVRDVHEIKAVVESLDRNRQNGDKLESIQRICDTYLDKVQGGTVGFQFYDKLTQRLKHAADSLKSLRELSEQQGALQQPERWEAFRKDIKSRYNTEKDRKFYEALMEGATIKEAIRIALEAGERNKDEGSVELF